MCVHIIVHNTVQTIIVAQMMSTGGQGAPWHATKIQQVNEYA